MLLRRIEAFHIVEPVEHDVDLSGALCLLNHQKLLAVPHIEESLLIGPKNSGPKGSDALLNRYQSPQLLGKIENDDDAVP